MNQTTCKRGGAPVGFLSELEPIEASAVTFFRLWHTGKESRAQVRDNFSATLGFDDGREALGNFRELCNLCVRHGRRPLMRHHVSCKCLGADESCFANFIATAADGNREDAMLIATLLVRADMAPCVAALAENFGLALRRMTFGATHVLHEAPSLTQRLH